MGEDRKRKRFLLLEETNLSIGKTIRGGEGEEEERKSDSKS